MGIEALRWRMHEASDTTSMADMTQKLYPMLKSLYFVALQPESPNHQEALNTLLG